MIPPRRLHRLLHAARFGGGAAHPLRDRRCSRQNPRPRRDEREPAFPLRPRFAGGRSAPPRRVKRLRANTAVCGGAVVG
jgi:hypothetical protein